MGKLNERLDRTKQAIEQAFGASGGYHGIRIRRGDGWPPIRVYFGEADCCITASFGMPFGTRTELLIGVPEDWLETVLAPGLALVNGAVVLQARPITYDEPVKIVEEAWTAMVMLPCGDDGDGVDAKAQFIVRYGGETNRGNELEQARASCLLDIMERLGIGGAYDAP